MLIQVFSNSMIFPFMELFFTISQFSMISRACGNPVLELFLNSFTEKNMDPDQTAPLGAV